MYMIVDKRINGKIYHCSTDATDFFKDDGVKQYNAHSCLDIMQNCLDTIYDLVVGSYPRVFKPEIFLADSDVVNAYAVHGREIVVTTALIFQAADMIRRRYNQTVLEKYGILADMSHPEVLSCLRVYFWRYIVLHELYHIWNGHSAWKQHYKFTNDGHVVARVCSGADMPVSESENSDELRKNGAVTDEQKNLTQQALELDADSAAVCMLVNLLMRDADARQVPNRKQYAKNQMALIFGALATAFCLFDGNSGAKFDALKKLLDSSHPLPSIRMFYAEEIADGVLHHYFPDLNDLMEVESEWQRIICDVEPDQNGKVDIGQVFYFTAYTEKAQRHLCTIKHRMYDMHDTLSQFVLGNNAEKLSEDEMTFIPSAVWFTDEGVSTKGWVNPATGNNTAIKAKPQPIVKTLKIGRNDPCPCGSGKKYKKCRCSEYHSD